MIAIILSSILVSTHAGASGQTADGVLRFPEKSFPGSKLACVAETYRKEANPGSKTLASDAYSIEKTSTERLNKPCLSTLSRRFYEELDRINNTNQQGGPRISILDEAGSGRHKGLQPGWLWKLAQKYSGGNSTLSVRLIGICLQDNIPVQYSGTTKYTASEKAQ